MHGKMCNAAYIRSEFSTTNVLAEGGDAAMMWVMREGKTQCERMQVTGGAENLGHDASRFIYTVALYCPPWPGSLRWLPMLPYGGTGCAYRVQQGSLFTETNTLGKKYLNGT